MALGLAADVGRGLRGKTGKDFVAEEIAESVKAGLPFNRTRAFEDGS